MRIAVLGDFHSNDLALRAALLQAEKHEHDHLVLLGDCLTFGVAPDATVELVAEAVENKGGTLLIGNHDQLYLDIVNGEYEYYEGLPDWIRESVDWTLEHMDMAVFQSLPWRDNVVCGDVFLAHANPFDFGDWRYLNDAEDFIEAANALEDRGFEIGIFGHTHRAKVAVVNAGSCTEISIESGVHERLDSVVLIVNSGSTGQPRNDTLTATFANLDIVPTSLSIDFVPVDYDVEGHTAALRGAGLSSRTLENLLRYFP